MEDRTNADAIAELARNGVTVPQVVVTSSGREFLILPTASGGAVSQDVTEPGKIPTASAEWIKQAVVVQTVDSLVDYLERFKTKPTTLFADIDHNRIVGLIDYHEGEDAGRVGHKVTMDLPYSIEWQTWTKIDGVMMGQLDFARFLEENSADIEAPDAADLLETCRDLQANRKVNFTKAVRTSSDNENFEYTDETTAGTRRGGVEIPTKFMLRIPVYFGGTTYSIGAFLRWRLEEGEGLKLGIRLHNREHVRQAVFKDVVLSAADQTDRPAYFGRI